MIHRGTLPSLDSVILHYLINKNAIVQLAEDWQEQEQQQEQQLEQQITSANNSTNGNNENNQTGLMTFVLETSEADQAAGEQEQEQQQQTSSTDLISDTSGIHASVSWSPTTLLPISNSTVRINFTDAFSGSPLNADVMYDLIMLNDNGTQVIEKEQFFAVNSTDTQTLIFPAEGQYQMELHINGLAMEDEGTPDLTRNGGARGYVIISGSN